MLGEVYFYFMHHIYFMSCIFFYYLFLASCLFYSIIFILFFLKITFSCSSSSTMFVAPPQLHCCHPLHAPTLLVLLFHFLFLETNLESLIKSKQPLHHHTSSFSFSFLSFFLFPSFLISFSTTRQEHHHHADSDPKPNCRSKASW